MGQQPNIEIGLHELPREDLGTAAPRRWRPDRPGVVSAPQHVPHGADFGQPGPDSGFALRLISAAGAGGEPGLDELLVPLVLARASRFGRAPSTQDVEVALAIVGLDDRLPEAALVAGEGRRRRWLSAFPHEQVKGRLALAEIDRTWWSLSGEDLRRRLSP